MMAKRLFTYNIQSEVVCFFSFLSHDIHFNTTGRLIYTWLVDIQ